MICKENKSTTFTNISIVFLVAITIDGVNTTVVENEARISFTAVNTYFFHSNNFDDVGYLYFHGD